ncbi:MAG: ribosome small subunit-dependent GTPase A [Elusimicrobia bacterium]|nr:ribosome small subunit-dependent GTPase A [Elusimicrobiota bacterium]
MPSLEDWGWDARWAAEFAAGPGRGVVPARVVSEHRGAYRLVAADGELTARLPGAMRHKAAARAELPAVGDWVAVEAVPGERAAVVRRILPRRTKLSRRASGEVEEEQVIAANLDTVFVTTALNADFNARRLERFLTVSRESGAEPVILLNKLDACPDPAPYLAEAKAVAAGAAIVCMSAKTGERLAELEPWLSAGRTVGFVGTSGVGKSTLVNRLLGEERLAVRETRAHDERGKHTTTRRELFRLPGGAVLLDTPGMREMQFWEAERGLAQSFEEIDALAASCRFGDCAHGSEPGCAVKAGVESGAVTPERLEAWRKLSKELDARRVKDMRKNWNNPPKGSK